MKPSKPEVVWKTLRIAIILMVANILLVTNFYIYSMYINNQSMDLNLTSQSLADTPVHRTATQQSAGSREMSISQALAYELPSGYHVSIKSINWPLTEEAIKMRTSNCGKELDANQITSTVDLYQGVKGIEYTFSKEKLDGAYVVTIFPNKRFTAFEDAQKIFSICPDGGQLSPKALSAQALMFTDKCPSGSSGKDCELIKTTIEPTLSVQ